MADPTTDDAAAGGRDPDALTRRGAIGGLLGAGLVGLLAACGSDSGGAATSTAAQVATTSTTSSGAATSTTSAASAATTGSTTATSSGAACVLTAEQEQGPYYYEAAHVRTDIVDGKDGVPMALQITVVDSTTCAPIPNAAVDVWMADALGDYSDTSSGLFLRGIQITDGTGLASFTSIYPGWYPGRTNHVHIKVHIGGSANDTYSGGHVSHTGNLFFPEEVSVAVAALAPYTSNTSRRTTLTADHVYASQNGSGNIMTLTPLAAGDAAKGYTAVMHVGVDPNATPALIGIAGTVD